jgi:hypothetical protein
VPVTPEQGLRIGSEPWSGRLEVGDGLAAPDDGEVLASVLDCVENVSEVSGCFGGTYLRHKIRLSDVRRQCRSDRKPDASDSH